MVVIDKSHGYKEVKNFGVVKTDVEADQKKSAAVTDWILSHDKATGVFHEYKRDNGERLVIGYSEQRAKKDAHNREKGIERLRKAYGSGVLTKASINKRGYNKFLSISKDVEVLPQKWS